MNPQRLPTVLGCAALVVIASGCASTNKTASGAAREVSTQTQFEDLQSILLAKFKGASQQTTTGGWLARTAQDATEAGETAYAAGADLDKWCQIQGGRVYGPAAQNVPQSVAAAANTSATLVRLAGMDHFGALEARSCDVQGNTYVLVSARSKSVPRRDAPNASYRYVGYKFAWISAQDLSAKGPAAAEEQDRISAQARVKDDADRRRREQEAQAAEQSRRETAHRKAVVLQRSDKGTQLVCTGRQHSGKSIADIWYGCAGQNIGIVTFAEFSQSGWRVTSQTLAPVLMTSGNVEHDATVIFEKAR